MATITVTRNTAVYKPPVKAEKPKRKSAPKAKAEKPKAKPEKPQAESKNRAENQSATPKSKANHRMWYAFDEVKLQNELLKLAGKHDKKHSNMEYGYAIWGDKIAVTESHAVWIIPKGNWYLNIETVFRDKNPYHIEQLIENGKDAEKIELTAEIREMNDNRKVRIFKNPKTEEEIWINADFLKLYDLERLQFKGTSKVCPIYIYDSGELAGIILPINHA